MVKFLSCVFICFLRDEQQKPHVGTPRICFRTQVTQTIPSVTFMTPSSNAFVITASLSPLMVCHPGPCPVNVSAEPQSGQEQICCGISPADPTHRFDPLCSPSHTAQWLPAQSRAGSYMHGASRIPESKESHKKNFQAHNQKSASTYITMGTKNQDSQCP